MPLLKIRSYPGMMQVFVASEAISHLAAVVYSPAGARYVAAGEEASQERVAGILYGQVTSSLGSGRLCSVVTQGIISGVMCGVAVQAGDRLVCASRGHIMPLNTISPSLNLISGGGVAGDVRIDATSLLSCTSGITSGVTGVWFQTGKPFAKALASGGAGSGIPILVTLGG